ncbi:YjbQ family protein [Roseomonas sp. KE2513]|uniref:secondary thiamine-phosphate synthase enzyme YjbQ n=1 Tax=Roseomonas sp. KE2513 TaxID=2479202 RepID=UPI0018E058E6|nr:secondary thiamine-phosphate synthase enzyme YjbQ [Roseomonas sp. KE2513]MBI0538127.1 YjbQ family protein [Roseomonas sp. KE2513]
MRQSIHHLVIKTPSRGLHEITQHVLDWVSTQGIATGLLTIWCRHTSASLLVQENASRDVRTDLDDFFHRLVPDGGAGRYRHEEEGPDDMPAHIRAALTQTQLSIPIENARPVLGTWQGIYLYEHRTSPHRREVVLHLIGEAA